MLGTQKDPIAFKAPSFGTGDPRLLKTLMSVSLRLWSVFQSDERVITDSDMKRSHC